MTSLPKIGYNHHIDALTLARKMGQMLLAAESTRGLGLALVALEQHEDALSVMKDAHSIYKQLHPNDGISPIMVRAEIEYAEALRNAKQYDKALKHAREAREYREYLNPNDPIEPTICSVLASVIFAMNGDVSECIALADEAIALSESRAAVSDASAKEVEMHTLRKLNTLALKATFLDRSQRTDAAIGCQEDVVRGFNALVGKDHPQALAMEAMLGMLKGQGPPTLADSSKTAASGSGGNNPNSEQSKAKKGKGKKRGRRAGKKNKLKHEAADEAAAKLGEATKGVPASAGPASSGAEAKARAAPASSAVAPGQTGEEAAEELQWHTVTDKKGRSKKVDIVSASSLPATAVDEPPTDEHGFRGMSRKGAEQHSAEDARTVVQNRLDVLETQFATAAQQLAVLQMRVKTASEKAAEIGSAAAAAAAVGAAAAAVSVTPPPTAEHPGAIKKEPQESPETKDKGQTAGKKKKKKKSKQQRNKEKEIVAGNEHATTSAVHDAFVKGMKMFANNLKYSRTGEGVYLLDDTVEMTVKTINSIVLVRVDAGGWVPLQTYLAEYPAPAPAPALLSELASEAAPAPAPAPATTVPKASNEKTKPAQPTVEVQDSEDVKEVPIAASPQEQPVPVPVPVPTVVEVDEPDSSAFPSIPTLVGVGVLAVTLFYLFKRKGEVSR